MRRLCEVLLLFFNGESALPHHHQYPGKLHPTRKKKVWRVPGVSWACIRPVSDFEWIHYTNGCDDTDVWLACGADRFSYGESPRTPPLEETSLHRRNMSVERPWGILGLFTTGFWPQMNSQCQRLWHRCVVSLWSRSFFLRWTTADPSPWGNFTPTTKHECRETLGDLEPVYDLFPITSEFALPAAVTQTRMRRLWGTGSVEKVVIFMVNHRRTLTSRELNWWNMILDRPWWGEGIFSLFETGFRSPITGTKVCD